MKLLFTGDVAFNQVGDYPSNPLSGLMPLARDADITVLSFDSAVGSLPGGPWTRPHVVCPPSRAAWLTKVPNLALNLANNHAFDAGYQAFLDTQRFLGEHGIRSFGVGSDLAEATEPLSIRTADANVAILGCTTPNCTVPFTATEEQPGPAPFDMARLSSQADALRKDHDFVILCLHWGREYQALPLPEEYAGARELLKSFDLVVGNHPHVVRGFVSRQGHQLYFSLGNTLFGDGTWVDGSEWMLQSRLTKIALALSVEAARGKPLRVIPRSTIHDRVSVGLDPQDRARREMLRNSRHLNLPMPLYERMYARDAWIFNHWTFKYEFRFKPWGVRNSARVVAHRLLSRWRRLLHAPAGA